jgi:beta-N-acetylhexosaminidase
MTKRIRIALPVAVLTVALTAGCGSGPTPAPSAPVGSTTGSPSSTTPGPSTSVTPTPPRPPVTTPTPTLPGTPTSTATTAAPTSPSTSPTRPTTPTQPASGSCADLASSLSLRQRVGQLFMVGVSSGGMTSRDEDVLADGDVGSVIFLQNSFAGAATAQRLVRDVRGTTTTPRGIDTMITVDQEGGTVQRLRGAGFDRIPSARRQTRLSDGELAREAEAWGRQLKRVGVDADLAPVADVVPTRYEQINEPIGQLDRGYGPDPATVARKAAAFVRGMNRAGITTSVKHFPGLGQVRGNTDFKTHVVDSSTTRHDPDLRGFSGGVAAGVDMVMVSTAFYDKIDPAHQAAFSSTVIQDMIRGDLGFHGVVISDDLVARAVRDVAPGTRAVRFLKAGGDLAIVGDSAQAPTMIKGVLGEASSDPAFAAEISAKATRVLTMKARRGLADCG